MNTATIEVRYVNPPKDGKQYGSIKGSNNDTWPVKRDRIHEFEPGNQYEIAFTEANNGFKNIIGVKRVVPQAEPETIRGNFTQVDMRQPQRNGATLMARAAAPRSPPQAAPRTQPVQQAPAASQQYYRPTAPRDAERMFVCATLGHFIDTGRLECSVEELTERVNILRDVWQNTFGADEN